MGKFNKHQQKQDQMWHQKKHLERMEKKRGETKQDAIYRKQMRRQEARTKLKKLLYHMGLKTVKREFEQDWNISVSQNAVHVQGWINVVHNNVLIGRSK